MMYYKLIGHTPVPCSFQETAEVWTSDRHVGWTDVGCLHVSTVFLVLDHSFDDAYPLLFETMIFGDGADDYQTRCGSWEEAEAMHAKAVAHAIDLVRKQKPCAQG